MKSYNFCRRETKQYHDRKGVINSNKASQAIQSPRTVPFFLLVSLLDGYSFPNVLVKGIVAFKEPGHVAQSVGHLTRKSGVLSSIPGLATYFRFSFRFFKKGSCQLLAKVCARSTG